MRDELLDVPEDAPRQGGGRFRVLDGDEFGDGLDVGERGLRPLYFGEQHLVECDPAEQRFWRFTERDGTVVLSFHPEDVGASWTELLAVEDHGLTLESVRIALAVGTFADNSEPGQATYDCVNVPLDARLFAAFREGYRVRVQLPLAMSEESLPDPDLVVARGDESTFERAHPTGRDCVMVLEVSWSSRRRDLRKAAIYGRGAVPHDWRLDIENRRLETYAEPAADGAYTAIRIHDENATVELPEVGVSWRVAELLPKAG